MKQYNDIEHLKIMTVTPTKLRIIKYKNNCIPKHNNSGFVVKSINTELLTYIVSSCTLVVPE